MANRIQASESKTYSVVLRCTESLIRIPEGRGVRIAPLQSEHGNYELLILQRAEQVPHIAIPIPRELWVNVTGPAPSLDVAIDIAAGSASEYLRQLAFGANAWHGQVGVHLAYDSTNGSKEREFFQNWVVDERGLPRVAREVDADLMYRLLVAITALPNKDKARVLRGIMQYTDALQHWKPGNEVYALSHLYMGIEAITPLSISREIDERGLKNRKQLEQALNGPPADSAVLRLATWIYRLAGGHVPSRLESWARREIIFRGDNETYRAAQRVSNLFEHGQAQHSDIHALAKQSVEKAAKYLREAILEFLPLEEPDRTALKFGLYGTPMKASGFERQILGSLTSEDGQVASSNQIHPYVQWEFNLLDYRGNEAGGNEMRVTQKLTPVIAQAAKFHVTRILFAGPTVASPTNIEFSVTRGDKPREEVVTRAGAHIAVDAPGGAAWAHSIGSLILNANYLPQLASFWLVKLNAQSGEPTDHVPFADSVSRILFLIQSDPILSSRANQCRDLWQEAIDCHEVRSRLAGAFTGEKGLVLPSAGGEEQAVEIVDPKSVRDLNDRTVELIKEIARLLDGLLALRESGDEAASSARDT